MGKRASVVDQVTESLRQLIATEYRVGDRLPNEKQLAEQLNVSRGSVREALGTLANQGSVTREWGVGTFVSAPAAASSLAMTGIQSYRDRVRAQGRSIDLRDARCKREVGSTEVTSALQLPAGSEVWHVYRLFAIDGEPTGYFVEHLPLEIAGVPTDPLPLVSIDVDLFALLNDTVPDVVAQLVTEIEAVAISGELAKALAVPEGHPVVRMEQRTKDADGNAIAYGVSFHRTDIMRVHVTR